MKPVIVFGNTSLCKMIYYDSAGCADFCIAGFTVEKDYLRGRQEFLGLPLLAFEDIEKSHPPDAFDMVVVFTGYKKRGREREEKYLAARAKGYLLRNYLSPRGDIMPDITWGDNNVVLGQTHLGVSGDMGSNNLIRQRVYLGHDFKVGSHNQITPGCTIGGDSQIGDFCYIGLGSTVMSGTALAEGTLIGAGSVVIKDTEPYSKNVGNPSRVIAYRQDEGDDR